MAENAFTNNYFNYNESSLPFNFTNGKINYEI